MPFSIGPTNACGDSAVYNGDGQYCSQSDKSDCQRVCCKAAAPPADLQKCSSWAVKYGGMYAEKKFMIIYYHHNYICMYVGKQKTCKGLSIYISICSLYMYADMYICVLSVYV